MDLVFLLGLSEAACLRSVSRSDPGCPDLCLLSYSTVSLFALGCSWPLRDSLDLSAGTSSPLDPAKDCSGPSIITSVQMHHRCQNHDMGVIPFNHFWAVSNWRNSWCESSHCSWQWSSWSYEGIRLFFQSCLHNTVSPTLIFFTALCLLLSAYCFIFRFCSRSRQRIIVSARTWACSGWLQLSHAQLLCMPWFPGSLHPSHVCLPKKRS